MLFGISSWLNVKFHPIKQLKELFVYIGTEFVPIGFKNKNWEF